MLQIVNKICRRITKKKNQIEQDKYLKKIRNSIFFDAKWYIKQYNVQNEKPEEHYFFKGWLDGNDPSLRFSTNGYLAQNENVSICPLLDYELYKKENNRNLVPTKAVYAGIFKEEKIKRYIVRKLSDIINIRKIYSNRNKKILVCLHIYYYYSFKEIKEYLKNLEKYNYDLIVTITKEAYDKKIINQIKNFKSSVKIIKCENYGFDIGPFFEVLNNINLNKYDVLIKLQSKGTSNGTRFVYRQIFKDRDWFINLYEGILGAFVVHKTIDKVCNDENVGLVASKNLIIEDPKHKKNLIKETLDNMKLGYIDNYKYVAGSCFAIKPKLLKESQRLKLCLKDFDETRRGCFSLAHIMERFLCFSVIKEGYSYYGNTVCFIRRKRWSKIEKVLNKYTALNILDKKYKIADDFVYYFLESAFCKNYYMEKVKIGDIKRYWLGKYYNLKDCSPYKYLNGDKKSYEKYTKYHLENNLPIMSSERFDKLIDSINKNGYIEDYSIVLNAKDNQIIDGQHRACILLKKYGSKYEVTVLKIEFIVFNLRTIKPFSKEIEMQNI